MTTSPTTAKPSVCVIGPGIMGEAVVRRLLECGFVPKVRGRRPETEEPLIALGAERAASPAEAAATCDYVILLLPTPQAVEEVAVGPDGLASAGKRNTLIIDMSTTDPELTRQLAARLGAETGMRWIDAPLSGGAPGALAGALTLMVGGNEADFEDARAVLGAVCSNYTLMGPVGAGQSTKMINQILVGCTFMVLAEAVSLANRTGVDAAKLPAVFKGGRADSRLLQEFVPMMASGNWELTGKISSLVKDFGLIEQVAAKAGAPLPMTGVAASLHRILNNRGLGESPNAAVTKLYED